MNNTQDYFHYCPDCQAEGVLQESRKERLKINKIGTDGYGQPVKFADCECGSKLNGFLYLDFYRRKGEIDQGLLNYLKHRIKFYHECFTKE